MQGRLENQIKAEKQIQRMLKSLPREVKEYYINFSSNKEFRTCQVYIQKLRKFLMWYCEEEAIDFNDIDFTKITDIEIAKYLKKIELKENVNEISYTSFSYRKTVYSTLNSFFEFLYRKKYITNNPVRLIQRPNKKDKVEHVFLSQKDLDKIIQTIIKSSSKIQTTETKEKWKTRDLAIMYTFIFTGMRESALCEMDMNRVDFENNILEVTDKENKINTYTIPVKLKELLLRWIDVREELLGEEENDAFFISNQRKRMAQSTIIKLIKKYSQEALGYEVAPHRIRAAFGNIIYEKTHDIELTSRAMKHENISTTRIYMESDEMKVNNKVANILESVF